MIPTLPRDAYVADHVGAVEGERIFAHQWFAVGRVEDVAGPGDYLRADVGGEQVLVIRGEDGALNALDNVCRHRGAELVDLGAPDRGRFERVIRCPYHQWTYGLDGQVRRRPFLATGDEDGAGLGLYPIGVDGWGGFLFVHLSPAEAQPLGAQLGPVVDRVRRYPLAQAAPRGHVPLRRRRQLEGDRRELQRVLPLRSGPPRAGRVDHGVPARWLGARVDRGSPQVLVALGAAHGFKFASWFGRALAELAIDGGTPDDISPFSITRPGLQAPVGREAWLV